MGIIFLAEGTLHPSTYKLGIKYTGLGLEKQWLSGHKFTRNNI